MSLRDWDEISYRFNICILNYYYQDLTDKYGISFFQYYEEGLGDQLGSVISINNFIFFLNCYFDNTVFSKIKDDPDSNNENREAIKISVSVRSFEYDAKKAFESLRQGLNLLDTDIYYVRDNLGIAKFGVYKNIKENLVNIFQTELDAQAALRFYEKKNESSNDHYFYKKVVD